MRSNPDLPPSIYTQETPKNVMERVAQLLGENYTIFQIILYNESGAQTGVAVGDYDNDPTLIEHQKINSPKIVIEMQPRTNNKRKPPIQIAWS